MVELPLRPLRPEHVSGATLFADRYSMVTSLRGRASVFVEVGVELGAFSEFVLNNVRPARFVAIDLFRLHEMHEIFGKPPAAIFGGKTHREYYEQRFASAVAGGVVHVLEGQSAEMLRRLPNSTADVIYVDAGHHLHEVLADAQAAIPKLKADGRLIFNDYIPYDYFANEPYGVVPVVNDLCVNHGWRVEAFALAANMFCDISLRRGRW